MKGFSCICSTLLPAAYTAAVCLSIHWPPQPLSILTLPSDAEYHLDVCTDRTYRSLIMIKTIPTWRQWEKVSMHSHFAPSTSSWLQLLSVTALVWIMQRFPALAWSMVHVCMCTLTWKRKGKGSSEWSKPKTGKKMLKQQCVNAPVIQMSLIFELVHFPSYVAIYDFAFLI